MTILLTGAKGFLGSWIAKDLEARGIEWRPLNVRLHEIGTVELRDISTVIHCAAKIPEMDIPDESYWTTNVDGTDHLLKQ